MSSFLVSNETLGAIALSAYGLLEGSDANMKPLPRDTLAQLVRQREGEAWEAPSTGIERLARAFYDMNIRALRARYDDRCEELIEPFEVKNSCVLGIPQLYKAVECLLYQCFEGKVPKEQLYQDLKAWSDELAHHIAHGVPEVKSAYWS